MAKLNRKPLIFAHRGACSYAPENTLAAFRLALEQGSDGIELDAKLSKDGVVVVIHDQTVDRTTNGNGKVSELTFAELQTLDTGIQFAPRYVGEKVPSLEQVLSGLGDKLIINIELTSYSSPGDSLPEKVTDLVKKTGTSRNIIFSSFHPAILGRIRKLMPEIPAGLAHRGGLDAVGQFLPGQMDLAGFDPPIFHEGYKIFH